MNFFKKLEDSLQSSVKPVTHKSIPEGELEMVKKLWEDIISWTMQRTLQEWSTNQLNSSWDDLQNLNPNNFFQ